MRGNALVFKKYFTDERIMDGSDCINGMKNCRLVTSLKNKEEARHITLDMIDTCA